MSKDKDKDGSIVSLTDKLQQLQASEIIAEEGTDEDSIQLGIEVFTETAEEGKGFIAIIFDEVGSPSVIHAGEFELIHAIGTLEFVKNELMNNTVQFDDLDETFLEDE